MSGFSTAPTPLTGHSPASWGAELRALFMLATPLAAANLLQMLVYAVDVVFVARLGDAALAASSLAVSIFGQDWHVADSFHFSYYSARVVDRFATRVA